MWSVRQLVAQTVCRRNFSLQIVPRRYLSTLQPRQSAAVSVLRPTSTHADDLPVTSADESEVAVGWNPQSWSRFHHIWLRDHCRCPSCFHPITKQRLVDTFEIPSDIKPIHVESKHEGLQVVWPESQPHTSFYPWSWLHTNSYDPPPQSASPEKILWGSKIAQAPPSVMYDEVMDHDDEKGVWKWLSNVDRFGFSFISGVPPTPEATEELARRIGFIRETQYGRFWDWTVPDQSQQLAKGDTAYTSLALTAHTDNTYFTDPSGLQFFHLLSHEPPDGGATLLVDGFYTASLLSSLHPTLHTFLSQVPISSHAAGEADALYRPKKARPVLDYEGDRLVQVRWNNHDRSVLKDIEPGMVTGWYEAARMWNKLLTSPDSEYWVQLQPGTAVVIDNHRVLHGRSAFTGVRRMCGAYIGWDEYQSRYSRLAEKFVSEQGDRGVWSSAF